MRTSCWALWLLYSKFQKKISNAPELIDLFLRRIFRMRPLSVRCLCTQASLWFGGWLFIGGFGFCPGFSNLFASGSSGPFSSSDGSCIGLSLCFWVRLELSDLLGPSATDRLVWCSGVCCAGFGSFRLKSGFGFRGSTCACVPSRSLRRLAAIGRLVRFRFTCALADSDTFTLGVKHSGRYSVAVSESLEMRTADV